MDEEVAGFWREFEEETGERVEAKAIGELHEGGEGRGIWFLLVLTDRSFWFKQVPSDNWITSLFRPRTLSVSARKAEAYTLRIPREALVALEEPKAKGWFARSAYPVVQLSWLQEGTDQARRFSLDPTTGLLARLRGLLQERERR